MSPVNIYRPRGFGGGYDHRFTKPFQAADAGAPADPNAGRIEAHASVITFTAHAHRGGVLLLPHGHTDSVAVAMHAHGNNLDIKVENE